MRSDYTRISVRSFILMTGVLLLMGSSTVTYRVTGSLGDSEDTPIAGYDVFLVDGEDVVIATDQSDEEGNFTLAYEMATTSAEPGFDPENPSEFHLGSSYPNPFNPRTTVPFHVPEATVAHMALYNLLGQRVMQTRVELNRGSHEIMINLGYGLSQGTYVLRVEGNGYSLTGTMTFISAGISSGIPGISVRPGAMVRSSITAGMPLDVPETYRIVVEESEAFLGKEIEVITRQDYDAGRIELVRREFPLEISIEGEGSVEKEVILSKNYPHGTNVQLTAVPAEGWAFLEWSGDIEGEVNPVMITVTGEVFVTAVFVSIYGSVTDIDGNEYRTVTIGEQEWMAENLRVRRYRDGSDIPTGLDDEAWEMTQNGAYAIYPHSDQVEGIHSEQQMAQAYGLLYNWYTVNDSRGLCPEGWRVPDHADWSQLVNLVNGTTAPNANKLKSRRQVDSPLGGEWATSEHPRWDSNEVNYGTDDFGFSAFAGGSRHDDGVFYNLGMNGFWWTATAEDDTRAILLRMGYNYGVIPANPYDMHNGCSVRCIRN